MKIAMFDTHRYDRDSFEAARTGTGHALTYLEPRLTRDTAPLARGHLAVCSFVNDKLDEPALAALRENDVRLITLRCAGFNHVDLPAAERLGLQVTRVPEYSPYAVAEHAVALVLALNRKVHRAYARVREWNFSLEGLLGFDLHGKTVGIVGTGKIGKAAALIFRGFGCEVLATDAAPDQTFATAHQVRYLPLPTLFEEADIVSLHVPLSAGTRHLVGAEAFARIKPGAMLINTGRGALIDSKALIDALKSGRLGAAGLDVYEEEAGVFFQDLSDQVLQDDVLARLLTFPNVLITSHQAFLTREALANIAAVTLASATAFERGAALTHAVRTS